MNKKFLLKKKYSFIFSMGLIISTLLCCACSKEEEYKTAVADNQSIVERIEVKGKIHGQEEITYYADVTATIQNYSLDEGDEIKKDENILSYDSTDYERAYEMAQLTTKQNIDNMNGQISKSDSYQQKYNAAKSSALEQCESYVTSRNEYNNISNTNYSSDYITSLSVNKIDYQIAGLNIEITNKQAELQRLQFEYSYETDTNKREDKQNKIKEIIDEIGCLNESLTLLQRSEVNYSITSLDPHEYALQTYYGDSMSDYLRLWTQSETEKNTYFNGIMTDGQKTALQDGCDLSKLNEDYSLEDLNKALVGIKSSSNGIVVASYVENGMTISKGMPICLVESTDDMVVKVTVSKYDMNKISIGQKANITLGNNNYDGTVSKINKMADTESSDKAKVSVWVHIDNPDDMLVIGLEADVEIITGECESALSIPVTAYYADDEGDYCYCLSEGRPVKKYIETGVSSGEYIQVLSGINKGDEVIISAITDADVK